MHPIDHHRKLIDAIVSPLDRSSDELRQPSQVAAALRDTDEFWPEPEHERSDMERMWRDRI